MVLTVRALTLTRDPRNARPGTMLDVADNRFHISLIRREGRTHLADMAVGRSDVEVRNSQRADVVDLARMNEPNKGVSHDHDMKIRRRKWRAKFLDRVVWDGRVVLQPVLPGIMLHGFDLAATADETEGDVGAFPQRARGLEQRRQRMT